MKGFPQPGTIFRHRRYFRRGKAAPAVVDEQPQSVPGTPDDEIAGDAMPETDHNHGAQLGDEDDQRCGQFAVLAQGAGQRVEEISPEPLGQGHVPVVPEQGQVWLAIRLVEVLGEGETQQVAQTNGDIGVTGEIEKQLE